MSTRHQATTAEIRKSWNGKEPIACRLCGVRLADDAPDAVWQGVMNGLAGPGFNVDEHVECDAIFEALGGSRTDKIDAFFESLGIQKSQHVRARQVLKRRL